MPLSASTFPSLPPEIPGYTIVEQLYRGSRTAVYRAVQTVQQRPTIVKVLQREYPSFGELVQFRNQYTIAKNLPIPGIVQPLSLEPFGSGYALVMDDWGGISLGKYIQQQPLNFAEVLAIAIQLADILHALHHHRVIHKDIKPANILIHPESKQVKLIDFSIASLLPKETQEIQNPNTLEGTLAYLAPEQTGRMNRGIDYRSDFYSLGVTLYQLLTGTLPYSSDDPLELVHCHIAKVALPIHQIEPDIPEMVGKIVAKLMAKNAEDRYQSALGLKHDLTECLTQWETTGAIAPFILAQRDLSDRFLIPEKLYGREREVHTLLEAFERVARGTSELMLVAGFSGIGKTAVVNEVHKPIVKQRGYFIKGKFDQFNRNIPLFAFVQVFRDLIGQLLCESDRQLAQWKAQILAAVGESGQVLMEAIPELEQIIGPQPPAPELSGNEAQNRFNLLFQKFIEVFTTADHPLVMFLDDLQWADSASLEFLKLLIDDRGYLLILGAYRDNEVSPVHPLILTVEEIKKAQVIVNTIALSPLQLEDINCLVADTLNCSAQLAQPLTQLIERKTQGNPFFITQFLKALHGEGYIAFNGDRRYWECDMAQISPLALTDDVVEFMAVQLQKLPPETLEILKLAACVGNQFDLITLAIVAEQSPIDTATALWTALQEGFILPTNQVYKFFHGNLCDRSESEEAVNPTYRFLHDRIQQAAYLLIPEDSRSSIHYQMGRLLLTHFSATAQEERLFEIVGHLNAGSSLILKVTERLDLAQLNLMAGRKAISSTAYQSALGYLSQGFHLLPQNAWEDCYELTLGLHHSYLEGAYLNGKFEELEAYGQIVLQRATSIFDCIKVYEVRISALRSQGRFLEAVEMGLQVLRQLGVEFPTQPTADNIAAAYAESRRVWQGRDPMSLLDLPAMQDPQILAAMQILTKLISSAYCGLPPLLPLLIFKQIELSVQYGNSPISVFSYADYGLILCGIFNEIAIGHEFGKLALALLDKLQVSSLKSRAYFIVNAFIRHWKEPLHQVIPSFLEGYRSGLESGNWEDMALSLEAYSHYKLWTGQELKNLAEEMTNYRQAIAQVKQESALKHYEACLQTLLNLLGEAEVPYTLQGSVFDENQALPYLQAINDNLGQFCIYFYQALLCYWFEQDERIAQLIPLLEEYSEAASGYFLAPTWVFYEALIQLRNYARARPEQQVLILERVQTAQAKLESWAAHAPFNHQHRCLLVAAEQFRVLHQKSEAIESYDLAIAQAQASGFLPEEAIANELAAKFYLEWGKLKIASEYLQQAYYCYARWGAQAKVADLESRYPTLLAPILQQQGISLSATETLFATPTLTLTPTASTKASSSSNSVLANLDLATVLKASQTLSSKIQLDKLLATLLHTVLENAGADKGALLMPREGRWFVEAVAVLDRPVQIQAIALSDSPEVPHSLIHTVKRNLESVAIINATTHPTLARDPYVEQHQPKSLLCAPILQQGKLAAILYLENQVAVGAFTSDRVELLKFLCSQAAISLENARLYQQAQIYTQQLEQSQLQIIQSEKMASLGNLVAGVAHEINNPIGFLNGSLDNSQDYVQDLLNHLELYQQHYPNPVAAIQDSAEAIDLEFLSEDLLKLLNSMKGAIDRIANISTSLRTFSRADTDRKVAANVHEGLDSTLLILKYRLKANSKRPVIEVIKHYGELPSIPCFPGQLNQVFMNLLANAIDALDESNFGRKFADIQADPNQIMIQTTVEGNFVQIAIADNGPGMGEEVKSRIFDHLFTTKGVGKGTGLGLAIAQQIVADNHGGELTVESELGQGSLFLIRLPIQESTSV
ncbi:AAA family ATPase [Geitlerinema splendidum]|nr:AAA family ATPase [Geitlerinema splendidum]